MMATVPHVASGLGLRKFQADGFLLTRVHKLFPLREQIKPLSSLVTNTVYTRTYQQVYHYVICMVLTGQNKQRLFHYAAITDEFL